jgi:TRAP transporter 4TM/12TM fusion protein
MSRMLSWSAIALVIIATVYHIGQNIFVFLPNTAHLNFHLAFCILIVLLSELRKVGFRATTVFMIVATVFVSLYVFFTYGRLEYSMGFLEPLDIVVGVLYIVLVIETARRTWGWVLPIITIISIAYFFFGHLISGVFHHHHIYAVDVVSRLSLGFAGASGYSGIFSDSTSASARFVIYFAILAGIFMAINLDRLFFEIGKLAGRFLAGGPGQTAIIGSGLLGAVTGVGVANVVMTGSFTIPMMKKSGYSPERAAAIEGAASTGAQIVPPIMGAAAFLMVATTGISYLDIMKAAILPSLIYYLPLILSVQLWGMKHKVSGMNDLDVNRQVIYKMGIIFLITVGLLVYLLIDRLSPGRVAIYATVAALIMSFFFKETRFTLDKLLSSLSEGVLVAARIGVAMGIIGLVSQTAVTTGIGVKFTRLMQAIAGSGTLVPLLFIMVACIVLGMGMPTVATYGLVSVILGPALTHGLNLEMLPAHFFLFYFAALSAVTPPVALAALTAAGLADAKYMKTAIMAFLMVLPAFFTPYVFVKQPALLHFTLNSLPAFLVLAAVSMVFVPAAVGSVGQKSLTKLERIMIGLGSIAIVLFYYYGWIAAITGIILLGTAFSKAFFRRPSVIL